MKLFSSAFQDGEKIPSLYTCHGKNINPPLIIENSPPQSKSLVLLMEDPDVPISLRQDRTWIHWIIYNIPPTTQCIPSNQKPPGVEGAGTKNHIGYQSPCPPDKEHRYFFKLYALDTLLPLSRGATLQQVKEKMEHHVIAEASLMGLYAPPEKGRVKESN